MGSALAGGQSMDLVNDNGTRLRQNTSSAFAAQQHKQGFGRGQEEIRRGPKLAPTFIRWSIAGAQADGQTACTPTAQRIQALSQAIGHVVGQRPEWRNV